MNIIRIEEIEEEKKQLFRLRSTIRNLELERNTEVLFGLGETLLLGGGISLISRYGISSNYFFPFQYLFFFPGLEWMKTILHQGIIRDCCKEKVRLKDVIEVKELIIQEYWKKRKNLELLDDKGNSLDLEILGFIMKEVNDHPVMKVLSR